MPKIRMNRSYWRIFLITWIRLGVFSLGVHCLFTLACFLWLRHFSLEKKIEATARQKRSARSVSRGASETRRVSRETRCISRETRRALRETRRISRDTRGTSRETRRLQSGEKRGITSFLSGVVAQKLEKILRQKCHIKTCNDTDASHCSVDLRSDYFSIKNARPFISVCFHSLFS